MDFYSGEDFYSDGDDIEDRILESCKKGKVSDLLLNSSEYPILYHLSDIRHNVIQWYPINKTERVLEIGSGCGAVTGVLSDKSKSVTCVELSMRRSLINAYRNRDKDNVEIVVGNFQDIEPSLSKYDVITLIGVWEYSALYISDSKNPFVEMLYLARKHLTENGRLFIAIENKTGMKYFNGDYEDHTGYQYSGLNDYTNNERVRTFSKHEIERMLKESGFSKYWFYYPLPDYKLPEVVYSDRYLPGVGQIRYFGKTYDAPRFYNFLDATMFDQVISDGMFSYFSNSFIVTTGDKPDVIFAKYNRERKPIYRIETIISEKENGLFVEKKALHEDAVKFVNILKNNEYLLSKTKSAVQIVEGKISGCKYISSYVDGKSLDSDFFDIRNDLEAFISLTKEYIEHYIKPDESLLVSFESTEMFKTVFGDERCENMYATSVSNIDLSFHNLKRQSNGKVMSFDFEWVFDFPIPYEFVIWRAADIIYTEYHAYLRNKISRVDYLTAIGIGQDKQKIFRKMDRHFIDYVYGKRCCEEYTSKYKKRSFMSQIKFYD